MSDQTRYGYPFPESVDPVNGVSASLRALAARHDALDFRPWGTVITPYFSVPAGLGYPEYNVPGLSGISGALIGSWGENPPLVHSWILPSAAQLRPSNIQVSTMDLTNQVVTGAVARAAVFAWGPPVGYALDPKTPPLPQPPDSILLGDAGLAIRELAQQAETRRQVQVEVRFGEVTTDGNAQANIPVPTLGIVAGAVHISTIQCHIVGVPAAAPGVTAVQLWNHPPANSRVATLRPNSTVRLCTVAWGPPA